MEKVPKLRFPEFEEEWIRISLNSIAQRVTRKNKDNETDLPLTISSLDGLVDQRSYFNRVVASKDMSGYYLLQKGEFAYNKSYSDGFDFGSIKRLDKYDMGALSTLYICFKLNDTVNSDFMVDYFNSQKWYREIYEICAEGARNHGLLNVPTDDFFKIKINIPIALEEQRKISDFLSKVDERISVQENIISDLENEKKGLMQKLFNQEVRFKTDDGSNYPDWSIKKLNDVAEGFDYGMNVSATDFDGENKYIRITDINDITHTYDTDNVMSPNGQLEDKYLVQENDILFARTGASTGKTYLYKKEDGKVYYAGFLIKCSVKSQYDSRFIYFQTLSLDYFKWVKIISMRSGQPGINANEYANYSFLCPQAIEEQKKIADFLSIFDKKIEIERTILEDWKHIKKGLLQQIFV